MSYEKDGIKKEIFIEVLLESGKIVPTVKIITPFVGFEKLVLNGDISSIGGKYMADFFITSNDNKIVIFTNKVNG